MMVIPSEQATRRYSRCSIVPKTEPFILAPFGAQTVSILGVGNSRPHSLISATMSRGVVMAGNSYSHPLHILSRADPSIPSNLMVIVPSANIGMPCGTRSHSEQ